MHPILRASRRTPAHTLCDGFGTVQAAFTRVATGRAGGRKIVLVP
jgi:hypothetical protein